MDQTDRIICNMSNRIGKHSHELKAISNELGDLYDQKMNFFPNGLHVLRIHSFHSPLLTTHGVFKIYTSIVLHIGQKNMFWKENNKQDLCSIDYY